MEDMPGKVQKANTHILRCQNHKHAHSSRSVQGPVQRGDGTLHMGSIRGKAHPLPRKHMATVSIPAGRWNVTHEFDSQESSHARHTAHTQGTRANQRGDGGHAREGSKGKHSHPAMSKSQARAQQSVSSRASSTGRWRICLGKGRRRAHKNCSVRIHVGVGQRCRAIDGDSPTLQAKSEHVTFHRGDGGNDWARAEGEHTS